MMFGLRHVFNYAECLECGTIQICRVPENLGAYYPEGYYSLSEAGSRRKRPRLWKKTAASLILGVPGTAWIARLLVRKYPFLHWAKTGRAYRRSAFLDVGCGSGRLLRRMQGWGFTDLHGVDPYAPSEIAEPGFDIRRCDLPSVTGKFDLIIFSHVLEHLEDPVLALVNARKLLAPKGRILVRVPVAGSKLAREYGSNWYNLDPPRHLVVPSEKGMHLLARKAGLTVVYTEFDSNEDSQRMSDSYAKGIPMRDAPILSRRERTRLRRTARELNRSGQGDLAAFFLVKVE